MATLSVANPTLLDWTKSRDRNGKTDKVAELLTQQNDILVDGTFVQASDGMSHRTTVRTGLPPTTWRKLYGGVVPGKSTRAQVTATLGMLQAYGEVDADLANLEDDRAAFRLSEEIPQIESMNQEMAQTTFYGNEASAPEEFTGLGAHYNDQSAANGENILTSAATPDATDNTSIWLVGWSPQTVFYLFPKGSSGGLDIDDKGQVTKDLGTDGLFEVYRTHYKWNLGFCVRDWRYVVRINYDLEDVVPSGATGPVLNRLMAQAMRRIPSPSMVRLAFYANRDSLDAMDSQAMEKSNNAFRTIEDAQGKMITHFRGVPVRRCDAILSTESGI